MACDTDSGERIAGESAARGTAAAARLATYLHGHNHDISRHIHAIHMDPTMHARTVLQVAAPRTARRTTDPPAPREPARPRSAGAMAGA